MSLNDPSRDLVVATPELVAFQYQLAGLGTRFLAQAIDVCLLLATLIEVILLAVLISQLTSNTIAATTVGVAAGFLIVLGYFLVLELIWAGQTPGKRALRIRVVGMRGEPVTSGQVVIRNLVRIVDFLPFYYALGVITMFANGQGRRLGDLAAGTLVVRESDQLSLGALEARLAEARPLEERPLSALEPNLRRLVLAYAGRRRGLDGGRRLHIAQGAAAALAAAAPGQYAQGGPMAALDHLADLVAEEVRPTGMEVPREARLALAFGVCACVTAAFCTPAVLIFGPLAILMRRRSASVLAARAIAETGSLLGAVGLIAGLAIMATLGATFAFVAR